MSGSPLCAPSTNCPLTSISCWKQPASTTTRKRAIRKDYMESNGRRSAGLRPDSCYYGKYDVTGTEKEKKKKQKSRTLQTFRQDQKCLERNRGGDSALKKAEFQPAEGTSRAAVGLEEIPPSPRGQPSKTRVVDSSASRKGNIPMRERKNRPDMGGEKKEIN